MTWLINQAEHTRRTREAYDRLAAAFGAFADAGFTLDRVAEPQPSAVRLGNRGLPLRARYGQPVQPNLSRIPGDGDGRAEAILLRVQGMTGQHLLNSLDERDALVLGRYGARQPTIAFRDRSAERLRNTLLASALGRILQHDDARDMMVDLALHYVVAQRIGVAPRALFTEIAVRLPAGPDRDLLQTFGERRDVTLEAFGWQLVETPDGPDFVPT